MDANYKSIETEFKPKARLLLQLGDQLIRNEKIALSELIKNSYDAGAKNVVVTMNDIADDEYFKNAVITIEDDGVGMNLDIIKNVWMEPGTNYKENKYNDNFIGNLGRRPIGEKGIGRFGIHKLGNIIKIVSKKVDSAEVVFEIDWNDFKSNDYLSDKQINIYERKDTLFCDGKTGTYIEIRGLHNPWTQKEYRDLYRSAFTLSSPFETIDKFDLTINTNLFDWTEKLLTLHDIKRHALWYFECEVEEVKNDNNNLETKITNFLYRFQPTSQMEVSPKIITIDDDFIKINPYIRLEKDKSALKQEEEKYKLELQEYKKNKTLPVPKKPEKFFDPSLENIGKITIKGYIFDFDPDTLELSDIEDIAGFKEYTKANGGVRVYRDNMRIYDYGEDGNDWLKMDAKRINQPTVKIANRNIISAVFLDGFTSRGLIEKTNREGFIENDDYEYFKGVVSSVINRVNKLRVIDKEALKRTYFEEQDSTINANVLIEKTKNKISKYITDTKNKEEVLGLIERVEENYNSVKDIVLKSSGAELAYSLVMHEIEKMISSLEQSVKDKDYEELFEISKALSSAIDNITSLLSNDKVKLISVFDILNKAFYFFKRRFKKHEIEIIKNFENKEYVINCLNSLSVNAIMNIMDNSIYWLGYWQKDMKSHGKIYVDILEKEDFIDVIIADNGKGFYISEDIAKLPFKTTKDENLGKGLGLYFVNEIMKQNDGYFKIITNKSFKKEELKIPDEFLNGATIILQFRKA
jgi:anti-sigma regulatory factor (Ser/Thr protein kinase)